MYNGPEIVIAFVILCFLNQRSLEVQLSATEDPRFFITEGVLTFEKSDTAALNCVLLPSHNFARSPSL